MLWEKQVLALSLFNLIQSHQPSVYSPYCELYQRIQLIIIIFGSWASLVFGDEMCPLPMPTPYLSRLKMGRFWNL